MSLVRLTSTRRSAELFIQSVAWTLFVTALVKLLSATGSSAVLSSVHPVFDIPHRDTYLGLGLMELVLAGLLAWLPKQDIRLGLIAMFGAIAAFYRIIASVWNVSEAVCPCLGSAFLWLHVPPEVLENIAKALLGYMLLGSGFFLWLRANTAKRILSRPLL